MRIILGIVFLFLLLQSCGTEPGTVETKYVTSYTIHLDSIPSALDLDSGRAEIYVDGELLETIQWTAEDLDGKQVEFTVNSLPGETVQIQYVLYVDGSAVAAGTDEYNPENPSASDPEGTLVRDTEVIEELLERFLSSSSSEEPPASSSAEKRSSVKASSTKISSSELEISSVAGSSSLVKVSSSAVSSSITGASAITVSSSATVSSSVVVLSSVSVVSSSAAVVYTDSDFNIAYTLAASSVIEGQTLPVTLILNGPAGATLPEAKTIQFQITGASPSDFSMLASTTLAKGMLVGQSKSLNFIAAGLDNLIEGSEIVSLTIGDAGGLGIGTPSLQQVTIQDADTAFIQFLSAHGYAMENSGINTVAVRLVTKPATAVLALPIGVEVYIDDVDGNIIRSNGTVTGGFTTNQGNGAPLNMTFNIGNNGVYNEFADRYLSIGLDVVSGPGILGANPFHTLHITEYDFEYYVAGDGSSANGELYIFRPNGATIEYVKTIPFNGVGKFTELTALPSGSLIGISGYKAWKLNISAPTPTITQWSSRTDIEDLEFNIGEGRVWVVTNAGKLYSYDTLGTSTTTAFPSTSSLDNQAGIQVGTLSSLKGGLVYTTASGFDMSGCTDAAGTAKYFSTSSSPLPNPNDEKWYSSNLLIGEPKGIAMSHSATDYYVATDGQCDAACAGLFRVRFGALAPVELGLPLNLQDVADLSAMPDGNLILVGGGTHCYPTLTEYGRVIVYNPQTDTKVREFSDDGSIQVDRFGGVAVIRNHVDLME